VILGIGVDPGIGEIEIDALTYDGLMEYVFIPGDEYYVLYSTKNGPMSPVKMRMGVFIDAVVKGSPIDEAGIPEKSFITKIAGTPVGNIQEFSDIMTSHLVGDIVIVDYMRTDGTTGSESVVLGDRNGRAFLGVNYSLSGFSFTTPDTVLAAIKNPLKDADSVTDGAMAALSYIGMPLRGYSPIPQEIQWWYESSIMNDQAFWIVLQTVFWIFWLNLVLAVTNALPAVPFDGGYLLRDGVGSIIDRTHRHATEEKREQIVNSITRVVSYIMLFILMLVMVAILF
jgi:membrane-associated protease RseP (regulator of RpoE activity)